MNGEKETVITGQLASKYLVLSAVTLVVAITASIIVLKICGSIFAINDLDATVTGERIGVILWLGGILFAVIRLAIKREVSEQ